MSLWVDGVVKIKGKVAYMENSGSALILPKLLALLVVLALPAIGGSVFADDLEPRAYSNTPVGMNFLIAGYAFSEGGLATDPSVPLTNAHLRTHAAILAYARALDLWGMSGKFDMVLPDAWVSGSADVMGQPRDRNVTGLADPAFRLSVNFYGAPALSLKEFADYKHDLIMGASLRVTPPLGQYDDEKLVNIGTNRWSFKPEFGISQTVGPVTLELMPSVTFYTDNNDFLGGKTREQDPIYAMQGHLIYSLRSGIWMSLDGNYSTGGRTTIDGVRGNDLQENSRVGATVALPVNRYNSVKLYASTGVSTRTGTDFDTVGIAWQYRWGAGL